MLESVRAGMSCATTFTAPEISDITVDVKSTAGTNILATWTVVASGCIPASPSFTMKVLEYDTFTSLASGTFDQDYTSYFSISSSAKVATFTYKAPANSVMKLLPEKVFKFQFTVTETFTVSNTCGNGSCQQCGQDGQCCNCHSSNLCQCSSATGAGLTPQPIYKYFTVTWRNVCLGEVFVLPALQEDIVYQVGDSPLAVGAFDFTVGNIILGTSADTAATAFARCAYTHTTYYRTLETDVWLFTTLPIPNFVAASPARDSTTLAFSVSTAVGTISTPGDNIATRYVRRVHQNSLTGESIEEAFKISFVASKFCYQKTPSFVTQATIPTVVIGTLSTIAAELNTTGLVTTASTLVACQYSAKCYIFTATTQDWDLFTSALTAYPGISCATTGAITLNIPSSITQYNPSTVLTMKVVYEIVDSQVPLSATPSRQITSQFQVTINSLCVSATVSHGAFPDIVYYVGAGSIDKTYSPVFSGVVNANCPQTVTLSLKKDGQGDAWTNWSAGSFTIGLAYTFIPNNLVTTGLISDLGKFHINSTEQATFRPGIKFNARITLYNAASTKTDTLYFNISMIDVCEVNELTQTSSPKVNIVHTIARTGTTPDSGPITWTAVSQNTVATYISTGGAVAAICPLTRELWVQSPTTLVWLKANDQSTAGKPTNYASVLMWVGSNYLNTATASIAYSASTAFSVQSSISSSWYSALFSGNIGKSYNVQLVSYEPLSKSSKNKIVEEFSVTFAKECNSDSLCIAGAGLTSCLASDSDPSSNADVSANLVYVAGSTLVTIPKSMKQSVSGCPLTYAYEYFNTATNAFAALSTLTTYTELTANALNDGSVNVNVASVQKDSFCPQKQYLVRVTYTSTDSVQTSRQVYDEYTVTIKAYSSSSITLNSSIRDVYTYTIPETTASPLVINPIDSTGSQKTVTVVGSCPITCILQRWVSNTWTTIIPPASYTGLAFVATSTNVCRLTVNFLVSDVFWTGTTSNQLSQTNTSYDLRIGVQYTNALVSAPGVYAVYDDFQLVMQHHCINDFYTLTTAKTDIVHTILATASGGNYGTTNVPATIVTQSDSTCSSYTVKSLEWYNPTTKVWVNYAGLTASQVYVQNYSASTAVFNIQFLTNLGSAWDGKEALLRIKTTNSKSQAATGTIYDQFKVTFQYECAADELSITYANEVSNYAYYFAASAAALPSPTLTHTQNIPTSGTACPNCSACAKTYQLFAFFDVKQQWVEYGSANIAFFISNFVTSTGVATVSCSGIANIGIAPTTGLAWKPQTIIKLKVVATSIYSKTTLSSVTDEFTLTLSDNCSLNKIALDGTTYANKLNTAGINIDDFSYTIGTSSVSKLPLFTTVRTNAACPIQAKLYVFDEVTNKWVDKTSSFPTYISAFSTTTGQVTIFQAQGTYQTAKIYSVKISFTDMLAVDPVAITKEYPFEVTIKHTCDLVAFTINEQSDITYTVPAGVADVSTDTTVAKTVVSNTNSDYAANCLVSQRTDYWNDSTNSWTDMTGNWASFNFIKTNSASDSATFSMYSTNLYILLLQFSALQTFTSTYGSAPIKMRSRITDITGRTLYDEYKLIFKYACWTDSLSITQANNKNDQIYEFGQSSGANVLLSLPSITQSVSGCTLAYQVYGYFNAFGEANVWQEYISSGCSGLCLNYIIKAFSTTTGQIQVANASGTRTTTGDLKPSTQLQLKIVATSTYSQSATKAVEDQFTLLMRQSQCVDNLLAFDGSSWTYANHYGAVKPPNVSYQIGATAVNIDPKFSTKLTTTLCPLTAQLFVLDDTTNLWVEDSTLDAWISAFRTAYNSGTTQNAGYLVISQTDSGFVTELKKSVKIRIFDPLAQNPNASAIETIFTVNVYHKCSRNSFTINDVEDISFQIQTVAQMAVTVLKSIVSSATSGCTLEYTIETFDTPTNTWKRLNAAAQAATYTFVVQTTALDATTSNLLAIKTTDFATWANKEVLMRQRVRDPNSTQVGGNVTDEFKVKITYICNLDEITITTQLADQVYYFAATTALTAPVFAQSKTGCAKTTILEVYSTTKRIWVKYVASTSGHDYFIQGFNASSGVVTISNSGSDGVTANILKPETNYQLRISMQSTYSTTAKNIAIDEFQLTLQQTCYYNQLKMDGSLTHKSSDSSGLGAVIQTQDYKITSTALATTVNLTPLYSSSLSQTTCPLKATLFIWDDLNNVWIDQTSSFTPNWISAFLRDDTGANKAGKLTINQASSIFVAEKIYTVKISITDLQAANPTTLAIEHVFKLDVYHACQRNTLAFNQDQANVQFVIVKPGGTASPITLTNSSIYPFVAETICPLTRTLEIYDTSKMAWTQYLASKSSTYPWVTSWTDPVGSAPAYTTSTNGFVVTTADYATYDNELISPSVFQMRMKVQDYSSTTATALIYDYFNVELKYECDDDVVSLTSDISMYVYSTIVGAAEIVAANFVQTISPCVMLYKAEIYQDLVTGTTALNQPSTSSTASWIDVSSSSPVALNFITGFSAGALTIQTSTTYDPYKDFQVRITYTSKYSQKTDADRIKVENFVLRLTPSSACIWNTLAKTSEIPNWQYIVKSDSTADQKTPTFTRSVFSCLMTQKLYFLNKSTNVWIEYESNKASYPFVTTFVDGKNTANTNIGQLKITATRSTIATSFWKPSVHYSVKIVLDDVDANHLQALTYLFDLELRDICAENTLTMISELADTFTYVIGSGDSTAITPLYTASVASSHGCIITATLSFFNPVRNKYIQDNTGQITTGTPWEFVKTFQTTTTGQLVLNTANVSKYANSKEFLVKINIAIPEATGATSVQLDYFFKITIKHACADNILSIATDLRYQIYYIDTPNTDGLNTTGNKLITPSITSGVAIATCPLTCTLQQFDTSELVWVAQGAGGLKWSWLKTFTTASTGVIDVWTNDVAQYHPLENYLNNNGWTDVDLRVTCKDPYSASAANTVTDDFKLSLRRPCSDASLTQNNELANFTYYINSGNSANVKPTYTSLASDGITVCVPYFYLHFWDTSNQIWVEFNSSLHTFVGSWTALTGTLVVNTADFNTYDGPTLQLTRITTRNTLIIFQDQFTITLMDKCRVATLTTGISVTDLANVVKTEADPHIWDMWQFAEVKFNQIALSSTPTACPITYVLTDVNFERTPISQSIMIIDSSSAIYQVKAVFRVEQTRFYYVRAVVSNVKASITVLTNETKYYVKVSNPCVNANQITAQSLADQTYWIKDSVLIMGFNAFADTTTTTYGNISRTPAQFTTGDNLCGPKTYLFYRYYDALNRYSAVLHDPFVQPWISMVANGSNWQIKIQTNDPKYFTNAFNTFYVRVSLDNYSVLNPVNNVRWEPIRVNLKNCQITDFTFTAIADVPYNVYTPIIYIPLVKFTEVNNGIFKVAGPTCGYTVTYTAKWRDFYDTVIPLPTWIVWNPTNFQYEIYTDDPKDINHTRQIYKLELTASIAITDMNPIFQKTQVVNLIVSNGCLLDEISIITSISDYTYYINENTEKGTWVKGLTPKPKVQTWIPRWAQRVPGCPLRWKLYRTLLIPPVTPSVIYTETGARFETTTYERTPIYQFDFPTIPVNVLWSVTSLTILPFKVTMSLATANYAYDKQKWRLHVVQESIQSTHANREGSINFTLDLLDVCWELPLTTFLTQGVLEFTIWQAHNLQHLYLDDSWTEYCTGSSYMLEYVSGSKLAVGALPSTVDMMSLYIDKNKFKNAGQTGNALFAGTIPDISWEGVHTMRIVAQQGMTKKYNVVNGPNFTVTYINPCRTAIVTPKTIAAMENTVGKPIIVEQYYEEFKDNVSTLYGNGFDRCGARNNYLTQLDGTMKTVPDIIYKVIEYVTFTSFPNGLPTLPQPAYPAAYKFEVVTSDYSQMGLHKLLLNVELALYKSTSTKASVPLDINIKACVVTDYRAPEPITIDYVVGGLTTNTIFYFNQTPCVYKQKFSALLSNGQPTPKFMTLSETDGYLRFYATNTKDVGQYDVVVTGTLDNVLYFGSPTQLQPTDIEVEKRWFNPTFIQNLIYKTSFIMRVNVKAAPSSYVKANNTAPYLIPEPTDIWLYASDKFVKGFGPTYDNEGNAVTITYDFGKAQSFIIWDKEQHAINVPQYATSNNDIGIYPMTITLTDNASTNAGFTNVSWFGNVTYSFNLKVLRKPILVAQTAPKPDVRLQDVLIAYNNSVIDVRNYTKETVYNATDTSIIRKSASQVANKTEEMQQTQQTQEKPTNKTTLPLQNTSDTMIVELPRVTLTKEGVMVTKEESQVVLMAPGSQNKRKEEQKSTTPPQPFVQSLNSRGEMKLGFDQKMYVPAGMNLNDLVDKKVALRWLEAYNETYLTPDGYRDFEIHPAIELTMDFTPDSNVTASKFGYKITNFTEDGIDFKITFDEPDYISSSGISADAMRVTFWDTSLLVGQNGIRVQEGQTLQKTLVPQVNYSIESDLSSFGSSVGVIVAVIIGTGLLASIVFEFDKTPLWTFFNIWQLILHIPLLNLKVPGFACTYWRTQLNIWTMRNAQVSAWMEQLSGIQPIDRQSYTIQLEQAGFNSTQIYVNLGLIIWIPLILIALMPLACLVDNFCSIKDARRQRFGGRKPLTTKPLLQMLTNLLARYALLSVLDVMICVFVSLMTGYYGGYDAMQFKVNMSISLTLLGLYTFFFFFVIFHGVWRHYKAKKAKAWKGYDVSGYVNTLYEGANEVHPGRTTVFLTTQIARQVVYAATIVFLFDQPVMQLFVLIATSIIYNCILAQSHPYYRYYNMTLHYLNEFAFFAFLLCCMTFTEFVSNITDRTLIAAGLSQFMFVIMTLNIVVCLLAVIVWAYEKYKPTLFNEPPAVVAVTPAVVGNDLNVTIPKEKQTDITIINQDSTLQNILELPEEEDDVYSGDIIKIKPNNYDDENGILRPIPVLYQHGSNDRYWDNIISDLNQHNGLQPNPEDKQNGPEEGKEEDNPDQFENYLNKWEEEVKQHPKQLQPTIRLSPDKTLESCRDFTDVEMMLHTEIAEQVQQDILNHDFSDKLSHSEKSLQVLSEKQNEKVFVSQRKLDDAKQIKQLYQPETSEDDAIALTRQQRKDRNRKNANAKHKVAPQSTKSFETDDILEQAMMQNQMAQRITRKSPSPQRSPRQILTAAERMRARRSNSLFEPDMILYKSTALIPKKQ